MFTALNINKLYLYKTMIVCLIVYSIHIQYINYTMKIFLKLGNKELSKTLSFWNVSISCSNIRTTSKLIFFITCVVNLFISTYYNKNQGPLYRNYHNNYLGALYIYL